ncbi:alpha-hydroxy-acid oxidizing enzyme [Bordetella genomosp. 10]|uniref:Alpha-hydroxy-acid oxidizing enzyme n=1 Tax=Bordetella genomosp. 10 TaxID=1416804 RepID=A0A261SB00_9BORD|nr:alpha-hydroxy acid oxidase [Bordetella genomosp. 10]OZI34335.1 alpha-hydroxy-acid oxidizing enzyme [Bordetella genomosp. 10]
MGRRLAACLNLDDFEAQARRRLPRPIFGYIHAAAEDRHAHDGNRAAFRKHRLVTRVLVDATARSPAVALFGVRYAQPFGLAPVGLSALYTYRGDCVLAEVAARRGIPMVMSASSLIPMETVARVNPAAWFQAYVPGDRARMDALLARILKAGFRTLVVTVDTPAYPNKEAYARSGFTSPLAPSLALAWQGLAHPAWTVGTFLRTLLRHGMPHFENNYATRGVAIIARNVERSFADRGNYGWDHLARIRAAWPHTLVVKGVLDPRDAVLARDAGADGIIVSNHGGRQLDDAAAPLDMLPEILRACPGLPVMLDGGVRRGTDVLKAYALGAAFVFVGRPFAYAAATGGRAGVERAVDLLAAEVDRDMVMMGVGRVADIGPDCLRPAS